MKTLLMLGLVLLSTGAIAADVEYGQPENAPEGFQATEQVLIPAGQFEMGYEKGGAGLEPHPVALSAFYIDKHEVTNAQWQAFCEAKERKLPVFWGLERFRCGSEWPNNPVVGISHGQARAYAAWVGARLPTEAEWEYAARGGLEGQRYHTGDELPSDQANTKSAKIGFTSEVGSFAPNVFGLYDMVGNVREWVWDNYSDTYFAECAADGKSADKFNALMDHLADTMSDISEAKTKAEVVVDPQGPKKSKWRVIKGGGWYSGKGCNAVHVRNALPGAWSDFNVGFRCARDVPEEKKELPAILDESNEDY